MNKVFLTIVFTVAIGITLFSQEETSQGPWTKSSEISFTFSQVSLTNWAAGGDGSVALNAMGNFGLNYKEGKDSWKNKLELAYGLVKSKDDIAKKSNDKILFESMYGRRANEKLDWSAMVSFRSQFVEGYNYPNDEEKVLLSNFLSPGYLFASVGINWKPVEYFSAFFGPVTPKLTIVNDENLSALGAFGLDPGENTRFEFGGLAKFSFKKDLFENVNLASDLELYSNYLESPENIDIIWDVIIFMKINKYLTANLTTNLLYDDDIMITDADGNVGPRVQLKEILGVGLTFKF